MYKKLLVILTLMFSIVPFASVNAQSLNEGIDYCLFLPADDCQLMLQSEEVMSTVSSFAFDLSMAFDISADGGQMEAMGDMNFGIDGSGMLAFDSEALQQYQEMAMGDPSAMMDQMPAMLDSLFSAFEGEAYITITLPQMAAMMTGGATEIPLNILMKDGVYALDVASLETALGEDPSGMGWAGINVNGAFETLMADMDMSSLGGGSAMGLSQFSSEALQEAVTITRLADTDIDGTPVAEFEMVINYGALLTSDELSGMLDSMYGDMGMDQETIDMTMSLLKDIEIYVNQYIGLEDSYNYGMNMSMDFDISGEMMDDPTMESMSFVFDLWFGLSDFNTAVDVELPENAMIMPAGMLMGS